MNQSINRSIDNGPKIATRLRTVTMKLYYSAIHPFATIIHLTTYYTMKLYNSAINLFATIIGNSSYFAYAAKKNVKISQSDDNTLSLNERNLNSNNKADSLLYPYERGYLFVIKEDDCV
jgi:hypothetical protein